MIIGQLSTCEECRDGSCRACKAYTRRKRARDARKAREETMKSLGLKKVRGDLGGTYWE